MFKLDNNFLIYTLFGIKELKIYVKTIDLIEKKIFFFYFSKIVVEFFSKYLKKLSTNRILNYLIFLIFSDNLDNFLAAVFLCIKPLDTPF